MSFHFNCFSKACVKSREYSSALIGRALAIAVFSLPSIACIAEPLSLSDAQRRAVQRSHLLVAQDAGITASREMAVAAGQLPDPVLKFGIDNLPIEGSDGFSLTRESMTMRRIGLMQEVTRADKREFKSERYRREADKADAERNQSLAAIERDTALAWLDRYHNEAMSTAIAEQAQQAKLEIDAAESAYRSGRVSQSDLIAARTALALVEDRASEIARRLRTAKTVLMRWVGDAASSPLSSPPDTGVLGLHAKAVEDHVKSHPEIVALSRQEAVAAIDAQLAKANKRADWTWEVAFQQRGPAFSNMISVGVSIPLQWDQKNRQDREVASKLAMIEEARARREEAQRMHVAEIRSTLDEWENGVQRRARYERELLPLAAQRTLAVVAAYRGGKATLGEVFGARRGEAEMRLQALQLDLEVARLWAQLSFIVPGGALPSGATPESKPVQELK
ncbi:TolC family protein [soil metagenome]